MEKYNTLGNSIKGSRAKLNRHISDTLDIVVSKYESELKKQNLDINSYKKHNIYNKCLFIKKYLKKHLKDIYIYIATYHIDLNKLLRIYQLKKIQDDTTKKVFELFRESFATTADANSHCHRAIDRFIRSIDSGLGYILEDDIQIIYIKPGSLEEDDEKTALSLTEMQYGDISDWNRSIITQQDSKVLYMGYRGYELPENVVNFKKCDRFYLDDDRSIWGVQELLCLYAIIKLGLFYDDRMIALRNLHIHLDYGEYLTYENIKSMLKKQGQYYTLERIKQQLKHEVDDDSVRFLPINQPI